VELEKDLPSSEVHRLAKRSGFVNLGPVRGVILLSDVYDHIFYI
jgi:hypothetical protein